MSHVGQRGAARMRHARTSQIRPAIRSLVLLITTNKQLIIINARMNEWMNNKHDMLGAIGGLVTELSVAMTDYYLIY